MAVREPLEMTIRSNDKFAIMILAAGKSARLGHMKQLVTIKGKSLIEKLLEQALGVSNQVYCVLGFNAAQVQERIDHLPIKTIINSNWSEGMASSIAAGVDGLAPEINAVMIILVDQWQLTSADLLCHQDYWQDNPLAIVVAQDISAACAGEKIGPPVIFPQVYFAQLRQLTGKQGAKPLLQKYQNNLLKVPLAHAFIDIDTPEQLDYMKKKLGLDH